MSVLVMGVCHGAWHRDGGPVRAKDVVVSGFIGGASISENHVTCIIFRV